MKKQAEADFREKCRFALSLRHELFCSLNILADPNSRIHPGWRKSASAAVGSAFDKLSDEIGHSWEIWPVLATLLPGPLSNPRFEEIIKALQQLPIVDFQRRILRGLLHTQEAVDSILAEGAPLKVAISRIPKTKREWIGHIGFYPYDPRSPQIVALEELIADPMRFRDAVTRLLEIYWQRVFKLTWDRLRPQLSRSLEAKERLFHACSFAEFSRQALLRIEVKEGKAEIRALRGGYRLPFREIEACYFLPSAFNDRRFWSAFKDDDRKTIVYFPYFDPSLTLDLQIAANDPQAAHPALDPALIFKALGDSTRFAIATVLARQPASSVALAKILSVSKPTISHHVHLLREAGLIEDKYLNGAVELQLRRSTLEKLSELTIAKLFDAEEPPSLIRTRGGAVS